VSGKGFAKSLAAGRSPTGYNLGLLKPKNTENFSARSSVRAGKNGELNLKKGRGEKGNLTAESESPQRNKRRQNGDAKTMRNSRQKVHVDQNRS